MIETLLQNLQKILQNSIFHPAEPPVLRQGLFFDDHTKTGRYPKDKKKIYEIREDGSHSKEEFTERKRATEDEIVATKTSLNEATSGSLDREASLNYAKNFVSDLPCHWSV